MRTSKIYVRKRLNTFYRNGQIRKDVCVVQAISRIRDQLVSHIGRADNNSANSMYCTNLLSALSRISKISKIILLNYPVEWFFKPANHSTFFL